VPGDRGVALRRVAGQVSNFWSFGITLGCAWLDAVTCRFWRAALRLSSSKHDHLILLRICPRASGIPSAYHTNTSQHVHNLGRVKGAPAASGISTFHLLVLTHFQERIARIIDVSRVAIHYGYLPLILYLGYSRSEPKPSLIR
jgi:import receptor subunit TOM7